MSDVTITVRGEHEERIAPERATIHVTVRTEGAARAAVVDHAMRLAEPVRTGLSERQAAGTLIEWTSKRLAVRAERPWNNQGKRLALVYHASIDFTATFGEASELSVWVSEISAWDGVEVGWVNWHLTPQTRADVEREVASAAVGVAVQRAQAYAGALGLESVTPLEIADTGLISREQSPAPQMMKARGAAFATSAESGPAMEYEPEDIVVSATVEARFTAR
ncbi:SIMPL domain-containing protein [Microbacterium tenebrionis]|uniref:SIMPL domain-containing protein n=1 Tax=Microbacterium tenebrionis TaxID=2830665 RepID=UPI00158D2546|nr:SIMPL domain-containing protein [Microbacterium ihumii]